ncbi:MAG: hypothetical protein IJ438_00635 [Clostridia bacterium]|nr:hypothetical protein [Clostridia bacterium]
MKAIEVYQSDLVEGQEKKRQHTSRQEYYQHLRDALYHELRDEGKSEWLDKLVHMYRRTPDGPIYVLDAAAVNDCYKMLVFGRSMADTSRGVPYFELSGQVVAWERFARFTDAPMARMNRQLLETMEVLRAVSRQMQEMNRSTVALDPESEAAKTIENLRMMATMQQQSLGELRVENAELRRQLDELSEGVISQRVQRMLDERARVAMQEAEQLQEQRRQEAETVFQTHFASLAEEARTQRQAEDHTALQGYGEAVLAYDAIRQDMAQSMNRWAQQLHDADHLMLAQSYVGLYRTANDTLDGTLMQLTALRTPAVGMEALLTFKKQLDGQMIRMENAMRRLGLQAVRPQMGEAYEPGIHMAAEGAEPGARIVQVTAPGVAAMNADGTYRKVLIPAEVTVE